MDNARATIQYVGDQFRKIFPRDSFDYFFLDDFVNRQYAADRQFGNMFGLFSGLAIFVAGLGLFGLSTFMITQRTKEIAIRKVLGATIGQMIALFSSDYIKLIVIANAIALPVAYWLVSRWLDGFAFHATIGWLMFAVPASVLMVITLGTIVVQTTRTGFVNPAKSLKVE